jgi:glutaminyl-tRNA synthetase
MEEGKEYRDYLNPDSLEIIDNCYVEPSIASRNIGEVVQFMRIGYFTKDKDSTENKMVFNRTVALKDSWAKIQGKE